MKKRFLKLLLVICLIIPCALIFTACGEEEGNYFTVTVPTESGTGYSITYDVNASNNQTFEVEADSTFIITISLQIGYKLGDLQVLANGTALPIDRVNGMNSNYEDVLNDYANSRQISYKCVAKSDIQITIGGGAQITKLKAKVLLDDTKYTVKSIIGETETVLTNDENPSFVEIEVAYKQEFYLEYTLISENNIISDTQPMYEVVDTPFFNYNNGEMQLIKDNNGKPLKFGTNQNTYKCKISLKQGTTSIYTVTIGEPYIVPETVQITNPSLLSCETYEIYIPNTISNSNGFDYLPKCNNLTFGVYVLDSVNLNNFHVWIKSKNSSTAVECVNNNRVFEQINSRTYHEFSVNTPIVDDVEIYVTGLEDTYNNSNYKKLTIKGDCFKYSFDYLLATPEDSQKFYNSSISCDYITKNGNDYVYYFASSTINNDLKLFIQQYSYSDLNSASYKINEGETTNLETVQIYNLSELTNYSLQKCISLNILSDGDKVITLNNCDAIKSYTFTFPAQLVSEYNIQYWNEDHYDEIPPSNTITLKYGENLRLKLVGVGFININGLAKIDNINGYFDAYYLIDEETGLQVENEAGVYEIVFRNISENLILNANNF